MKYLSGDNFIELCKASVREFYMNNKVDISNDEVFLVWYSKTIQDHKALLTTSISDDKYYEITYSGDDELLYVDVYKKEEKRTIEV